MKKIIALITLLIVIAQDSKSQDVTTTLSEKVDKSISATTIILAGDKIILKGSKKSDEPITITCDILMIDATVTKMEIHGYVKLVCKQYIDNHQTTGSITIPKTSNSDGILFIKKPSTPAIKNIIFINECHDLEIKDAED